MHTWYSTYGQREYSLCIIIRNNCTVVFFYYKWLHVYSYNHINYDFINGLIMYNKL